MRVENLINQAKLYLPYLDGRFADNFIIKKVIVENGVFTIITEKELPVKSGEEVIVFLKDIPLKINVKSIEKIKNNEALLKTIQKHDQTKDPRKDYKVYINIQDCSDSYYNGKTEVLEDYQDGGHTLRIKVNEKASDKPDVSKTFFLIQHSYRPNGLKRVKIIDKNALSFEDNDKTLNYTVESDGMSLSMNTRVYPAFDLYDAKAQFNRNMQKGVIEDKINNTSEAVIKIKKTEDFTAFICLDTEITNTASNDTSVGYYIYPFSVFVFMMHRDIDKYKIRDLEDIVVHKVFNRVFGEKTIQLNDGNLSVNKTGRIKFIKSNLIEQRENDLSIVEIKYELKVQTFIDDYALPRINVRLDSIDMNITGNDSLNTSNISMLL